MNWKRFFVIGSALSIAGCSSGWSPDEKSEFMDDCLTNVRLEDPQLRILICTCWMEQISEKYSLAEINSGNQKAQATFLAIGKECSAKQGIRASLPGDIDLGADATGKDADEDPGADNVNTGAEDEPAPAE